MNMQLHCHECEDMECQEIIEIPELHKEFILKVYLTAAFQFLLTIIGAAVVAVSIQPLAYFIASNITAVLPFCLVISLTAITAILCVLHNQHLSSNNLLLGSFTTALAILVGLTCAVSSAKFIVEGAILTAIMVSILTLCTFWTTKKGLDFEFLGSFLVGGTILVVVLALIQILFPQGRVFVAIYGFLGSITFCGYIVYVTDSLIIKSYSYDNYIWVAVSLYVDITNLFLLLLTIFKATNL